MNIENINKAIAVMERAKVHDSIDMKFWQSNTFKDGPQKQVTVYEMANTEEELHRCGNKACFAGYLAVSPEWLNTPGYVSSDLGVPKHAIEGAVIALGSSAVARFLDISVTLTEHLINDTSSWNDGVRLPHPLYKIQWHEVKVNDVIRELFLLRDLGEIEYSKKIKYGCLELCNF